MQFDESTEVMLAALRSGEAGAGPAGAAPAGERPRLTFFFFRRGAGSAPAAPFKACQAPKEPRCCLCLVFTVLAANTRQGNAGLHWALALVPCTSLHFTSLHFTSLHFTTSFFAIAACALTSLMSPVWPGPVQVQERRRRRGRS